MVSTITQTSVKYGLNEVIQKEIYIFNVFTLMQYDHGKERVNNSRMVGVRTKSLHYFLLLNTFVLTLAHFL